MIADYSAPQGAVPIDKLLNGLGSPHLELFQLNNGIANHVAGIRLGDLPDMARGLCGEGKYVAHIIDDRSLTNPLLHGANVVLYGHSAAAARTVIVQKLAACVAS